MQSDKELLELAAKAIGEQFHSGHITLNRKQYEWVEWNPLTDNGDALRLGIRLRLDISFLGGIVEVCWFDEEAATTRYVEEPINDAQGECEATRRAIVRAAADIGATQPIKDGGAHA